MTVTTQLPGQPLRPPPPPSRPAVYGRGVAPHSRPARRLRLWVAGVLVVGGLALAGVGAYAVLDTTRATPAEVRVAACIPDGAGVGPTATVEVTNHGSGTASFVVTVEFVADGGTRYGTGTGNVNNLPPGKLATADAVSYAGRPAGAGLRCRITHVTRF
jgi:hypothetical protein